MNTKLTKILSTSAAIFVATAMTLVAAVNPYQPGLNIKAPTITANNYAVTTYDQVTDGITRITNGTVNAGTGIITNGITFLPATGKSVAFWVTHKPYLGVADMLGQTNIVLYLDHGATPTIMTTNQPLSVTISLTFNQTNHVLNSYGYLDRTNFPASDYLKINHYKVSGASQSISNITVAWPRN